MSDIVLDVSWDQAHIDFAALKAATLPNGDVLRAVIVKATEGLTYTDGLFSHNYITAEQRGIPVAPYHFFRGGDDGVAQAQHFLRVVNASGGFRGRVTPMVDAETFTLNAFTSEKCSRDEFIKNLALFTKTVESAIGSRMIVYAGYGFWNDTTVDANGNANGMAGYDGYAGHPCMVAAYNNDPVPPVPNGWDSVALHQYTDDYRIDGIDGPVDASRLFVPIESLIVHG